MSKQTAMYMRTLIKYKTKWCPDKLNYRNQTVSFHRATVSSHKRLELNYRHIQKQIPKQDIFSLHKASTRKSKILREASSVRESPWTQLSTEYLATVSQYIYCSINSQLNVLHVHMNCFHFYLVQKRNCNCIPFSFRLRSGLSSF